MDLVGEIEIYQIIQSLVDQNIFQFFYDKIFNSLFKSKLRFSLIYL